MGFKDFILYFALTLFITSCSTAVNEVPPITPEETLSPQVTTSPQATASPQSSNNDSIEKATPLSIQTSLIGDIQLAGSGSTVDFYAVAVTKDVRINIRSSSFEGSVLDTFIELLDSSSTVKLNDDDSGAEKFSFLSFVPTESTTVYVKITAYSGYGKYQISASLEKEGTAIFETSHESSFESKIISLTIHAVGTDPLVAGLAKASGAIQNGKASITAYIPNTTNHWKGLGTYHVSGYIDMDDSGSVSSSDYIITNFSFTLYDDLVIPILPIHFSPAPLMDDFYEADNTKETAKEIITGTSQARSIHSKNEIDVDWLFFSATEGDIHELRTTKLGENDVDTIIELYSSSGVFIMKNDDESTNIPFSLLRFQAPVSAIYYIKISKYSSNSDDGEYLLSFMKKNLSSGDLYENDNTLELAREGSSAISVGETQLRSFSSDSIEDIDWIAFSPEAGKTYRFKTSTAFGDNTDTVLSLYDGNALLLSKNDNENESSNFSTIDWTAPNSNPVYLKIEHYQQETALYRVSVSVL